MNTLTSSLSPNLRFPFFLFFISGFSSLTYQSSWNKILSQTIGVDFYSNITVLAIFMFGLGVGGGIGSYLSKVVNRPFFVFLLIELIVSTFAILSPVILRFVPTIRLYLFQSFDIPISYSIDFLLNFIVLLIPTLLMGMTLPLMMHHFRNYSSTGITVGFIYGINIIGAVFGAFFSGVFALGILGISKTIYITALINLGAIFYGFRIELKKNKFKNVLSGQLTCNLTSLLASKKKIILLISFFIGFVALSFEVLYFRILVYYFSATAYVFPIILTNYLILMFLGNYSIAFGLKTGWHEKHLISFVFIGVILTSSTIFLIPNILSTLNLSNIEVISDLSFRTFYGSRTFTNYFIVTFLFSFIAMLPIFFISMIFPLLVNQVTDSSANLGKNTGLVYLIQTFGNFLGIIVTSFLLIPLFGSVITYRIQSIILIIACLLLIQIVCFKKVTINFFIFVFISIFFHIIFNFPFQNNIFFKNFTYDGKPPTEIHEDIEGTVFIYGPNNDGKIRFNVGAEPSTSFSSRSSDLELWPVDIGITLLGRDPKQILIVGIGSGEQIINLHNLFPNAKIVIVELLGTLIQYMEIHGSPELKEVLAKSEIIITDGSRYLNNKTPGRKFDYIQIGVYRVSTAGAGNLFTREFLFRLKENLAPNGIISFNANASAVKACKGNFKNVIIASRGKKKVADVFLTDRLDLSYNNFSNLYSKKLLELSLLVSRNKLPYKLSLEPPKNHFFYFNPNKILDRIDFQSEDLLATEYFVSNTTTFSGLEEDGRFWPGPNE